MKLPDIVYMPAYYWVRFQNIILRWRVNRIQKRGKI